MPEGAERPVRSFYLAYRREVMRLARDPLILVPRVRLGISEWRQIPCLPRLGGAREQTVISLQGWLGSAQPTWGTGGPDQGQDREQRCRGRTLSWIADLRAGLAFPGRRLLYTIGGLTDT
jgi:hypothetical protein